MLKSLSILFQKLLITTWPENPHFSCLNVIGSVNRFFVMDIHFLFLLLIAIREYFLKNYLYYNVCYHRKVEEDSKNVLT